MSFSNLCSSADTKDNGSLLLDRLLAMARVCLRPTLPHKLAGMRVEPPPSLAAAIGRIPEEKEEILLDDFLVIVEEKDGNRINKYIVKEVIRSSGDLEPVSSAADASSSGNGAKPSPDDDFSGNGSASRQ